MRRLAVTADRGREGKTYARSPVDCCQCIKHDRRKWEACQVEARPSFELDHMRIRVSAAR